MFDFNQQQQRNLIKILSLILINAKDQPSTISAFRNAQPTGAAAKRLSDRNIIRMIDSFKEKHKPIAKYLCSDQGVKFMNIDGAICSKVINHFTDMNEPILSVHDSYICREHFKDELIEVMNEIISDTLQGYVVGIKANKELQD